MRLTQSILALSIIIGGAGESFAADDPAPAPAGVDAGVTGNATDAQAPAVSPAPAPAPAAPVAAAPAPDVVPLPSVAPRETGGVGSLLPPLQIHAFASQGFIRSTENNYLAESKSGSFEFTEVGINFTQPLTDRVRTGVQLFARQLGKVGDYRPRVDWFYIDYLVADWLGIRAGRTKLPFGLYNEIGDTDSARVPILLPQAVYPTLNRDMLLAQTGMELYGYVRLGILRALEYRLYGGTLFIDQPAPPPGTTSARLKVPYIIGGRLMWETPLDGLRVGGSAQALRINTRLSLPPPPMSQMPGSLEVDLPFVLWLASIEFAAHDWLLAAEYGRWHADVDSTISVGGTSTSSTKKVTNERFYGMAAYRVMPWFAPGVYYSYLIPDVDKRQGQENYQHDVAATLRFDLNSFLMLKLEGHFMHGTADVQTDLNDGTALNLLAKDWFLFLAKTTAYF